MRTSRTLRQRFFDSSLAFQQHIRLKAQAIGQALSPARILAVIDRLEVPACSCARVSERVCAHAGEPDCPCEQSWPRECECSWHTAVCEHVKARLADIGIDDWAALLLVIDPADYDEPAPPDAPALALSQNARVELMADRHDVCVCGQCRRNPLDPECWAEPRHCNGVGLRHPCDEIGDNDLKVGLLPVTFRTCDDGEREERLGRGRSGRIDGQRISPGLPPRTKRRKEFALNLL